MNHTHSVIVLGLYFPGIDILKDLTRRDIPCIGIDCFKGSPGLLLRKIETFLGPDPEISESEWVNFLLGFKKTEDCKPVLMITSDKFILPLLSNAETLSKYFIFNTSKNTSTERLMNKKGLVEAALKSGTPIAKTIFYNQAENFNQELSNLKYPCLIRPAYGKKWLTEPIKTLAKGNKLIKVENTEELQKWLEIITPFDKELMIQEMIPGPDENLYYLVIYLDQNQNNLGYFCGQKLRITPIHFGSASYMKTVDPMPVLDEALHLLKDNSYWGPAGVEFKKDEITGEFKIVEINTRFGLWDVMGSKLGVDLFYQAYLDLTGQHPLALRPEKKTYYWISITRDIGTFYQYHRENLIPISKWIKSYLGKVYFADLYWSEPKIMYNLYVEYLIRKLRK